VILCDSQSRLGVVVEDNLVEVVDGMEECRCTSSAGDAGQKLVLHPRHSFSDQTGESNVVSEITAFVVLVGEAH